MLETMNGSNIIGASMLGNWAVFRGYEYEDENLPKAASVTLFCLLEPPFSVETIPILQNFVQQHQPKFALSDSAQCSKGSDWELMLRIRL